VIAVYLQADIPWRPLATIAVAASVIRIAWSANTLRLSRGLRHATAWPVRPTGNTDGHR